MPRGDKTGPMGQGSKTGRGKGFCSGSNQPGYMDKSPGGGRGLGRRAMGEGQGSGRGQGNGGGQGGGRGMGRRAGRGWRNNAITDNYFPDDAPINENPNDKESLVSKAKQLEAELASIKTKLTDLESK